MREFTAISKALADENRVRVLMLLRDGELCLCQIIEILGLAPSTVSKHMAILLQAGLVEARKEGRWHYYRLAGKGANPVARRALRWLKDSLASDKQVLQDAKRLKVVKRMLTSELCQCYRR